MVSIQVKLIITEISSNYRPEMQAALEDRQPESIVSNKGLNIHPWDQASGKHPIVGGESEN